MNVIDLLLGMELRLGCLRDIIKFFEASNMNSRWSIMTLRGSGSLSYKVQSKMQLGGLVVDVKDRQTAIFFKEQLL